MIVRHFLERNRREDVIKRLRCGLSDDELIGKDAIVPDLKSVLDFLVWAGNQWNTLRADQVLPPFH